MQNAQLKLFYQSLRKRGMFLESWVSCTRLNVEAAVASDLSGTSISSNLSGESHWWWISSNMAKGGAGPSTYSSPKRLYHCTGFNLQRILSSQTCHTLHIGSCHIASCRWYHTISVQLCSIYTFKDMLWVRELAREPLSLWSPQDIPQDVTASWNLLDAHKPRPEWSVFPTGSELQHFWLRTLSCKLPLQSILIKVLKMWKTLLCRRDPKFIEGHRLA